MENMTEKQKAIILVKEELMKIKVKLIALNDIVAKHELLPVNVYKGKKLTTILDISCQCDEQIANLNDSFLKI
jgi:hypothetical protein